MKSALRQLNREKGRALANCPIRESPAFPWCCPPLTPALDHLIRPILGHQWRDLSWQFPRLTTHQFSSDPADQPFSPPLPGNLQYYFVTCKRTSGLAKFCFSFITQNCSVRPGLYKIAHHKFCT